MTQGNQEFSNSDQDFNWDTKIPSLRKWRLTSFKSVKSQTEINLAPLTVVVGANSSGKSTFIQSILLMAQNAMSLDEFSTPKARGQFELNGSLVQLGTIRETTCDLGNPKRLGDISIGGRWHAGARIVATRNRSRATRRNPLRAEGGFQLDWDISFKSFDGKAESGIAQVKNANVSAIAENAIIQEENVIFQKANAQLNLLKGKFEKFSFDHRSILKPDDDSLIPFDGTGATRDSKYISRVRKSNAISFRSGLPIGGLVKTNIVDYVIDNQLRVYREEAFGSRMTGLQRAERRARREESLPEEFLSGDSDKFSSNKELVDALVEHVANASRQVLQRDKIADDETLLSVGYVEQEPFISLDSFIVEGSSGPAIPRITLDYIEAIFAEVRTKFRERYGKSEWIHEEIYCTHEGRRSLNPRHGFSLTSRLVEFWNSHLAQSVAYLGPLRVGPRAIYGIGSSTENKNIPIGESGEFLAKKLFNERALKSYPILENGELRKSRLTLENAVSFWYKFLTGLEESNQINVDSPSRQGYPLNVGERTLANIGFGASQILPVIGICLDARPGTLILLEQPELHLNPGMQQKLADFLLYMARTGRQIIVETHSEYLITRLRRNAASTPDDHKYFTVIYVERNIETGTSYRTVSVDDQGDFSEWPKGFFDHVAEDLRVLMRRAADRQSGKKEQ